MKSKMPESFLNKQEKVKDVLQQISSIEGLIFKGGTSLSLALNILERFSEDIDISYDKSITKAKLTQSEINKKVEDEIRKLDWVSSIKNENGNIFIEFNNEYKKSKYDNVIKPSSIKVELADRERVKPVYEFKMMAPFPDAKFEMNVATLKSTLFDKASLIFEELFKTGTERFKDSSTALARHLYDLNILVEATKEYTIPISFIKNRVYTTLLRKLDGNFRSNNSIRKKQLIKMEPKDFVKQTIDELKGAKVQIIASIDQLVYPGASSFDFSKMLKNVSRYSKIIFKFLKGNYSKELS